MIWLRRISSVVLLCAFAATSQAKRIPNLDLKDLSGHTQKISSLRGSIAVVNFWATWCGPCREELPRLSQLAQDYSSKGVRFVAISIDKHQDIPRIQPYLTEEKITMDVWVHGDYGMLEHVGLGNIVPGTLIVDQQGEVVTTIKGEAQDEDIKTAVDWLLGNKQGRTPQAIIRHY
jgi:thiol-disulfide isomerase/thioredoxin